MKGGRCENSGLYGACMDADIYLASNIPFQVQGSGKRKARGILAREMGALLPTRVATSVVG